MSNGKFVWIYGCGTKNEGEGILMGFLVSIETVFLRYCSLQEDVHWEQDRAPIDDSSRSEEVCSPGLVENLCPCLAC
jgi:hypothetical protein